MCKSLVNCCWAYIVCPHLEVMSERKQKSETLLSALSLKVSRTLSVFLCQQRKSITDRIRQVSCPCCPETWACSSTHMPVPHSSLCVSVCVCEVLSGHASLAVVHMCVCVLCSFYLEQRVCKFVTNSKHRRNDTKPPGNLHISSTVIHSLKKWNFPMVSRGTWGDHLLL